MNDPASAASRVGGPRRLERPTGAPALYAQDGQGFQAVVHAHYFLGGNDWLVTEFDPTEDLAFGWACLGGDRQNAELGYVSLAELDSIRVPIRVRDLATGRVLQSREGQPVELDQGWPQGLTLEQGIAELDKRQGRTDG